MKQRLISEQHDLIVKMKSEGKTNKEIAQATDFEENSIFNYCLKHGIKKPHAILDRKKEIQEAVKNGESLNQVAKRMGLKTSLLYYYASQGRI